MLSFLCVILFGSALLALPISAKDRQRVPYIDALFTATTATCVTGLVTLPTATAWNGFGQAVILLLIQIGGLGIITVITGIAVALHRKIGLKDGLLISDAFNLTSLSGLASFVKKVIVGTLVVEGIGALLYMPVFIPEFGARGIWVSVFTSISAFCNAGIDVIAENSLCNYALHPLINTVTSLLIILGGIGYIVWWDVLRVLRSRTARKKRLFKHLTLHSKIAIVATLCLVFGGGALIFVCEYNNPLTIGGMSLLNKIQISLFQSVTTRTAGFATVPQEHLTGAASMVSIALMFIGGSPVGTAGGIKTVTLVALLCSAVATIRGKKQATVFQRTISGESLRKAVAVVVMFTAVAFTSILCLSMVTDAPIMHVIYESVSATATVGLSKNLTASLNGIGKLIIIATMYFGRVGPISLAIALGGKGENQNVVSEPVEEISIG